MKFPLQDRLLRRELGSKSTYSRVQGIYGDKAWVDGLDIVNELGGHSGCVNALSWSKSGRLLASGSDDQHLNIHTYQPEASNAQFSFSTTVATGHTANIFSVKFMPHSDDRTLVTCAGDAEVRVFDIEHSGRSQIPSSASNMASTRRGRGFNNVYNGVRYLSDGDTNARVYRSHGDRVKRIVTESSPNLFLTCSEDGEVRQWDLRLPSSSYPAPRGGRGLMSHRAMHDHSNVPPPLISYKRYHLDLNTISCAASRPHYIALGGAHLHCFLHDRRMLGRDHQEETGNPGNASPASRLSEHDDDLMGEATRCVRRFAPLGQKRMKRTQNGHITACKISEANPNELIASWSGDHIYSFDILQTPDVRNAATARVNEMSTSKTRNKFKEYRERKRKRNKADSRTSADGARRRLPGVRQIVRERATDDDLALRVRYENGQSEDLPVASLASDLPQSILEEAREAGLNESQKRSLQIAKSVVKIHSLLFSLNSAHRTEGASLSKDVTSLKPIFTSTLGFAASCLPEMDEIIRAWRYPIDPFAEEISLQRTLRSHRDAARRFVQAAGSLAKVLGGRLHTPSQEDSPLLSHFRQINPAPQEGPISDSIHTFSYDFLKAILLWLDGGPQTLLQGFKRPPDQRNDNPRFPVPEEAQLSGIDEYLVPYLLRMAHGRSVPNVDASRFEIDERRKVFETETAAVIAFSNAIKIPLDDLSRAVVTTSPSADDGSSSVALVTGQDSTTALKFWAFKVGRGLLMNAGEGIGFELVDRAFGGLGIRGGGEGRVQEDVNPKDVEEIAVESLGILKQSMGSMDGDVAMKDADTEGTQTMHDQVTQVVGTVSAPSHALSGNIAGDETGSDSEVILMDDLHNEIYEHMADHVMEGEQSAEDDQDDADEGDTDGDQDITAEERQFMWQSASDRGRLRESVEEHVPCFPSTRSYRGHCNVKTVKDVNFFGLQDEYVVSGSDSGHIFIWNKKTSQLVNILEGDGEVVNVVQGHPYEPLLAASGIDSTVKIFSPDVRAQDDARDGINLGVSSNDAAAHSSLYTGRRHRQTVPSAGVNTAQQEEEEKTKKKGGLLSRKRMHESYQIVSQNDVDRQGGMRDAFITRGMLARLATRLRARQTGSGQVGEGDEQADEDLEAATVMLDDNCEIM